MPTLPPSLLKEVIDKLPRDWSTKPDSVIPHLKKQGVKEEEIKASGIEDYITWSKNNKDDDTTFIPGKFSKPDLVELQANRADSHYLTKQREDFSTILLPKTKEGYEVTTRHFTQDMLEDQNWPSHFGGAKDIVWHTRATKNDIDGINTRLVQEIQSDLHQSARRSTTQEYQSKLPFNKTWYKKAIEQEILTAAEEGQGAIAIPLETKVQGKNFLKRSEGAETFYTTTVRGTLKKIAKQIGGEYKEVVRPYERKRPTTSQEIMRFINLSPEFKTYVKEKFPHMEPWVALTRNWDELLKSPLGKDLAETPVPRRPRTVEEAKDLLTTEPQLKAFLKKDFYTHTNFNIRGLASGLVEDWDKVTAREEFKKMFSDGAPAPGATIGQIVFPEKEKLTKSLEKFKLYTAAGATGTAGSLVPGEEAQASSFTLNREKVEQALSQGYKIPEIKQFLLDSGSPESDIGGIIDDTIVDKLHEADKQGIDVEEIRNYLTQDLGIPENDAQTLLSDNNIGITPTGVPGEGDMPISTSFDPNLEFDADTLASKYQAIHQKYATMGKSLLGLSFEDFAKQANEDKRSLALNIVTGLDKHNIKAEARLDTSGFFPSYEVYVEGPEGMQPIDSDLFRDLANSKYEITGAIAMGATLAKGVKYVPMHPLLKALTVGTGTALGAAAGRYEDIKALAGAVKELDNLNAQFYNAQMIDAGVADVTFGIIGTSVYKAGASLVNLVGGAYNYFLRGNLNGAYKALKNHIGMDDTQIEEIIKEWENVSKIKAPGFGTKAKAMHVIPQVVPGAEDIITKANLLNPRVGSSVIHSINTRARDVMDSVDNLTTENLSAVLRDDLGSYMKDVKNYYGGIKNYAIDAMAESPYRFDYDRLTIEPLFKRIERNIQNPATLERFRARLERVRAIGEDSIEGPPRGFADLLDLVKVVNDFRYNTKISGHNNYKTIEEIQNILNKEVRTTAKRFLPKGDLWLDQWRKANTEYSKMLTLKDNVTFKALTKKGIGIEKIVNTLTKDIKAIDGTFMQVAAKLPPKTRTAVEGAVLKKLVENNTIGSKGGLHAIHFPNLQEQLKYIGFTDPEVRETKRAITMLADVFKNDVNVYRSTGQLSEEKFSNFLATDPGTRLKMMTMNLTFNWFRKYLPTDKGKAAALIKHASKTLKNPSNSKELEDLMKVLPDDPELKSTFKQLAIEYAKFGQKEYYPDVKVYRTVIPGKSAKALEGKYGKGIYWTTDKEQAKARSKVTGAKVKSETFNPARIASTEDLQGLFGKDFDPKLLGKNPVYIEKLKENFFLGVSIDNQMVIFK